MVNNDTRTLLNFCVRALYHSQNQPVASTSFPDSKQQSQAYLSIIIPKAIPPIEAPIRVFFFEYSCALIAPTVKTPCFSPIRYAPQTKVTFAIPLFTGPSPTPSKNMCLGGLSYCYLAVYTNQCRACSLLEAIDGPFFG